MTCDHPSNRLRTLRLPVRSKSDLLGYAFGDAIDRYALWIQTGLPGPLTRVIRAAHLLDLIVGSGRKQLPMATVLDLATPPLFRTATIAFDTVGDLVALRLIRLDADGSALTQLDVDGSTLMIRLGPMRLNCDFEPPLDKGANWFVISPERSDPSDPDGRRLASDDAASPSPALRVSRRRPRRKTL